MIERVLISMPEKFLKDVDDLACYENRSRSELIREALRVYMNRQKVIDSLQAKKNADILEELL